MSASARPARSAPRSTAGTVSSRSDCSVPNGWTMNPSATSPASSVMRGPTPPRKIFGHAVRVRPGVEERGHQRVPVELAAEVELRAVVPARPDRPDREHELTHALDRVRPRHREPLLDVRLDLRAESEPEAAVRRELEVVRDLRQVHRVARERNRNRGGELHAFGVLGREQQREERVVLAFEREHAVVARRLDSRAPHDGTSSRLAMVRAASTCMAALSTRSRAAGSTPRPANAAPHTASTPIAPVT